MRGKTRLLLADTCTDDPDQQVFTDAEIDAFLSMESQEIFAAAAAGAESIAASKSRSAIIWKALGTTLEMNEIPRRYMELAKQWRVRAENNDPWEEVGTLDYNITRFGVDTSEYIGDTRL